MLPVEGFTQGSLHRADKLEQIGIDVSHDIGRHGEGQDQGPFKDAPPGKIVHGGEPGGGYADQPDATANTDTEPQRIQDVFRENGINQMQPGGAGSPAQQIEADTGDRQAGKRGHDKANDQQGRVLSCAHKSECEL